MTGISKHLEYAANRCFKDRDIGVIATDPRFLILRLSTDGLKSIVIAAHAPHRGTKASDIELWWNTLETRIPSKYAPWPRILLTDANAHVGAEPCECIGSHQSQEMDDKDAAFSKFIQSQGLWLPSTFAHIQDGAGETWWHTNGNAHRLDYVALPTQWQPRAIRAWVPDDIEVAIQKEDHRPAMVDITFDTTETHGKRPQATKIIVKNEAPIWELQIQASIPWHVDVHTHAAALQDYIGTATKSYHTKPTQQPIKPTMTPATWDLVCLKRDARTHLHDLRQQQRQVYLSLFFQAWQEAISPDQLVEYDRLIVDADGPSMGEFPCSWQADLAGNPSG